MKHEERERERERTKKRRNAENRVAQKNSNRGRKNIKARRNECPRRVVESRSRKFPWRTDTLGYPAGSRISHPPSLLLPLLPPSSSPHPSTRNSTKILDPLHPRSFPEAAHLCPNTDLSPPSINSLGKHVTRGRLHPDTARKLPKVQRIPGTRQDCPFPPLTFRFGPLLHPCSVEKRKTGGTPRKSRRTSKKISLAWRYNNNK